MLFVMPVTVIGAVLLLRTGQSTKSKGDAAIAMISVGALAVGCLLMNIFSTGSNISGDVCSSLFGSTSILTLTTAEVWLCVVAVSYTHLPIAAFSFFLRDEMCTRMELLKVFTLPSQICSIISSGEMTRF